MASKKRLVPIPEKKSNQGKLEPIKDTPKKNLVPIPDHKTSASKLVPIEDKATYEAKLNKQKQQKAKSTVSLTNARKTATVKSAAKQASNVAAKKATGLTPIEDASTYKARQQRNKAMGTARQRATVKSKKK